MAAIRPFRAWRYNSQWNAQIGNLISPPFDTVSERQQRALYQEPYNSIHLSVPASSEAAAQTLQRWKQQGVLFQDNQPAIYVYYQYFRLPGEPQEYCRKGFICYVEATPWSERQVLRHEDTLPYSVQDRLDVLSATQLHTSPTHGLYTDTAFRLEPLMDASMERPIYQVEDYQGVRDVLSIIRNPPDIELFMAVLRSQPIILADGHHRYESSVIYRQQQGVSSAGSQYHMMYLTNTEAKELRIFPTHRLIHGRVGEGRVSILKKAARYFTIKPVEDPGDIPTIIAGKYATFGLLWADEYYILRLRTEATSWLAWNEVPEIKKLDVAVLHHLVIDKVLGIPAAQQRSSPHVSYEKSFAQCLYNLAQNRVTMALITNGATVDQVKEICHSGYLMPAKSTYFYPKAIGGFVFGSIKDDEL